MPSPEEASTSATPPPEVAPATFKSLGLIDPLLEALEQMKFKAPTDIQTEVLPHALQLPALKKLVGKRVILASASPRRRDILQTFVGTVHREDVSGR